MSASTTNALSHQPLIQVLRSITDPRDRRGVRLDLPTVLSLAVTGVLAGCRSLTAIWEHSIDLTASDLRPLGGGVGAGPRPRQSSIRRVLQDPDPAHGVLVVVESKRAGRCVRAPVPASASSRNALAIVRCPVDELTKNDREGLSGSSQRVLDLRWGGVQDRPADESVPLESTQGDCEHALGDSLNRAQQLPEPAPAVQAQLNDDENRPGVPDPIEDVAQAADSAVGLAVAFL